MPGKPLSDLQPFWQRVRARARVKDVRIHDLRHTFASTAVASSLAYDATVNDGAKITTKIGQLAAAGIIARDGV